MKHHGNKIVVASFKEVQIFKLKLDMRIDQLTTENYAFYLLLNCPELLIWGTWRAFFFFFFPNSQFCKVVTWILMHSMDHVVNFWNSLWQANLNMSAFESIFLSVFSFKRKQWNWNQIMFTQRTHNPWKFRGESNIYPREIPKFPVIGKVFGSLLFKKEIRMKRRTTISSAS